MTNDLPTTVPRFFSVRQQSLGARTLFQRPSDYRAFLDVLQQALARFPIRLIAFCLVANHWELVIGPAERPAAVQFLRWVASTHTRLRACRAVPVEAIPVYAATGPRPLHPFAELIPVCRDVERRALTAGLVRRAEDWPWSSLAERLAASGRLPLASAPFLASRAWVDYVNGRDGSGDRWLPARSASPRAAGRAG